MIRGAVMMFEHDHGLAADGLAGAKVWAALIADAIAGKRRNSGYSYVYVHRNLRKSLNLWHNGQTMLTSTANTGCPHSPNPARHVPRLRAHPRRHRALRCPRKRGNSTQPRRVALQRPGHPLHQLLQPAEFLEHLFRDLKRFQRYGLLFCPAPRTQDPAARAIAAGSFAPGSL